MTGILKATMVFSRRLHWARICFFPAAKPLENRSRLCPKLLSPTPPAQPHLPLQMGGCRQWEDAGIARVQAFGFRFCSIYILLPAIDGCRLSVGAGNVQENMVVLLFMPVLLVIFLRSKVML